MCRDTEMSLLARCASTAFLITNVQYYMGQMYFGTKQPKQRGYLCLVDRFSLTTHSYATNFILLESSRRRSISSETIVMNN
jgi:hypothetical protein